MKDLENKLRIYYITAIFGVIFAVIGFSYNAWRLELTEENSNIRTASFQVLTELAELEQIIYAAHYDKDKIAGNPRVAWVKVGLIVDLSLLIDMSVHMQATELHKAWSNNWEQLTPKESVAKDLVSEIDKVRQQVKQVLYDLD